MTLLSDLQNTPRVCGITVHEHWTAYVGRILTVYWQKLAQNCPGTLRLIVTFFQASLHSSGFSQAYDTLRRDAYTRLPLETQSQEAILQAANNNQVGHNS